MKLSPEGEGQVGALERTYEILEDFYVQLDPGEVHSVEVDNGATIRCEPAADVSLRIARVKNLNSLKTGELVWSNDESFRVEIKDWNPDEAIEDMAYIFFARKEIITGDTDVDPELMAPGVEGFLNRLSAMFGKEPGDIMGLNVIGGDIIETYVKFYGLLRHLNHVGEGKPWLQSWIKSELERMNMTSMGQTAQYVHGKLEFPYSSHDIIKVLYRDIDDRDQLSQEA